MKGCLSVEYAKPLCSVRLFLLIKFGRRVKACCLMSIFYSVPIHDEMLCGSLRHVAEPIALLCLERVCFLLWVDPVEKRRREAIANSCSLTGAKLTFYCVPYSPLSCHRRRLVRFRDIQRRIPLCGLADIGGNLLPKCVSSSGEYLVSTNTKNGFPSRVELKTRPCFIASSNPPLESAIELISEPSLNHAMNHGDLEMS